MSVLHDMSARTAEAEEVKNCMMNFMHRGQPFSPDKATATMRARSTSPTIGKTQRKFVEAEIHKRQLEAP